MKTIQKLIQKQLKKPLNIHQSNLEFTYQSTFKTTIHGRIFPADHKNHICVIMYHGLGAHTKTQGYIDLAHMWNEKGYDVIGIDMRNQGGKTIGLPKISSYGLYASGYQSLEDYYYTQLYIDSYLLVEVAKSIFPNHQFIANGGSQGGAIALCVASMHKDITCCLADMPSNTDIPFLIHESQSAFKVFKSLFDDYPEDKQKTLSILSHIDTLSFAPHIHQPTLLSSGSDDTICPTVTTYKIFDALTCKKDLILYPGYGHGGFDHLHFAKKLDFILKNVE
jgi:cephalosporin-C deacetylase